MKFRRLTSLILTALIAVTTASFNAGVSAAGDETKDLEIAFTKLQRGICDNVPTGKVETVKDSLKGEVVRFTIDSANGKNNKIIIDGYSADSFGIDVAKYKYMVLEMKFVSDTVKEITPNVRFLATTDENVTGAPYVDAENTLASDGNWYNVVIDMEKGLEGKIAGDSTVMKHIQYHIGGNSLAASAFGNGDKIYVSKMTLTNKAVNTTESTGKGSSDQDSSSNGASLKTDISTTEIAQAFDSQDLVIDPSKFQKGIVDNKDTGSVEIIESSDGNLVQVTINPNTIANNYVYVDGYAAKPLGIDIAKYKYMVIKMKLESDTIDEVYPSMRFLSAGGENIPGLPNIASSLPLESDGEWHDVPINMYANLKKGYEGKESAVMEHLQFACAGLDYMAASFGKGDKVTIGKITLTNKNPIADIEFTVSFKSGFASASGKDPEDMKLKPGSAYVLPEVPYKADGYEVAGWTVGSDTSVLYSPGTEIEMKESDIEYTAFWKEIKQVASLVAIDYAGAYYNGIVNGVDTATGESTTLGSKLVVEVIPNPNYAKDGAIILDGWSYGGAQIDLSHYKTVIVEYLYLSDNPVSCNAKFNIMAKNFSKGIYTVSREPVVEGRWATVSFDVSGKEDLFAVGAEPIISQAHIYPLGDSNVKNMSADDRIYIGKIIAIPEQSASTVEHEGYINGYENGTFGVSGNMSRAEACTIVARLSAGGDEKVPANLSCTFKDVAEDKWYFKYISYVQSLGYLSPYGENFAPDQKITRAEFVELVYNMGLLSDAGKNGTFSDVPETHERAKVISAAGKAGLVNGYANGDGTFSFKPDATITRAEVVKVINNAYGRTPCAEGIFDNAKTKFSDVSDSHWAFADIIDASVNHISYIDENGNEFWKYTFDDEILNENFEPDYESGAKAVEKYEALLKTRIQEIKNTSTANLSEIKGKKIYVSVSGNDSNDGLSEDSPVKTIAKANSLVEKDGAVLLKRGDEFRERWTSKSGVTYSAYGVGAKPIINANLFGDAANESLWKLVDGTNNIWLYANDLPDVGNIVINGGEKTIEKLVDNVKIFDGKMHLGADEFDVRKALAKDEWFVCVYNELTDKTANLDSSKLYVRCDEGNPGKVYDSIEIAYRGHAIVGVSNVTYDNLCIKYSGSHGISMGTVANVVCTNCEIGFIGGSCQTINVNANYGSVGRFGNGIEIYGGCDNYVIDNCYVYQCYDAGITHQRAKGGSDSCVEQNVYFRNNVIEKCIYNIEYFMGKPDNALATRIMKNINYVGNLLAYSGEGWGMSPGRSASIKGWDQTQNHAENFTIENNIFLLDKVNAYDFSYGNVVWKPVLKGNIYVQKYGNTLTKVGLNDAKQYMMDGSAVENIQKTIGDSGSEIYYVKP